MKNTKLYPFERNRYYAGKMLTSSDFLAEQTYFNNKRRFVNQQMYGAGVICGCGVYSLDDLSLLVESGAAFDGQGREIVIESSVVKKLSAIEGFEQLKTEDAYLCLQYQENPLHEVYTAGSGSAGAGEYEYNRLSESFRLFLMDEKDDSEEYELQNDFFTSLTLLDQEDFTVQLSMPATVCRGKNVRLLLRITKNTDTDKKLNYRCLLQTPVFLAPDGEHRLLIEHKDVSLEKGAVLQKEYWLYTQNTPVTESSLVVESSSARAMVGEQPAEALSGQGLSVVLTDRKPAELVSQEIGKISLEMKEMEGAKDYVRLAKLHLVRTDNAYIIERVEEEGVKDYITAPAQERLRSRYLEFFSKDVDIVRQVQPAVSAADSLIRQEGAFRGIEVASGILEVPLGENAKRGDVCYSGEIMHGLGKGNVYVQIGYEYIAQDRTLDVSSRNTIYGDTTLFSHEQVQMADAETAVKVLNDKGSFIVAVRLRENVNFLSLTYRWVAIRFPAGRDLPEQEDYSGRSISVDMPTVVMGVNENHYFHVRYNNMESCSIAYELTEPGSGEITADGVYTSPSKEGVYEIRVYCVDMPVICTYAYAIVKKDGDNPS